MKCKTQNELEILEKNEDKWEDKLSVYFFREVKTNVRK